MKSAAGSGNPAALYWPGELERSLRDQGLAGVPLLDASPSKLRYGATPAPDVGAAL
jgi:hypothetical protein